MPVRLTSWRTGLLVLLAMALAAGAFTRLRCREVRVVEPTRGAAAEVVYATGIVEPRTWAKIIALQRRRIIEMCDCEGHAVKKGDVLARLDDREERATLLELEARHDRLNQDVERLRALVDRNVTSRVTYDDKMTQLRESEARIMAHKARMRELELVAPIDGVVLRKDGEVGEIAGNNDVLFWIGQPKPLQVTAEVNEEDIAKVNGGQTVLLRHDGFPDGPLPATVTEVTPKGDPASKTFRATFALPDNTPLKIGMSVEANIVVREVKDALLVPADAIENGAVLVVVDGRLQRAAVKTGIKGTRMVEVLSGLDPRAVVVAPRPSGLGEGMCVRTKLAAAR